MKITLLHPPIDDPTLPYHSNAYLLGHLLQSGFADASMRDLNVEFVNYCLEPGTIASFYEEGSQRLDRLTKKEQLDFEEQEKLYGLWRAARVDSGRLQRAVAQLRDKAAFLDFSSYVGNLEVLDRYFSFLSALCYPAEIANFNLRSRGRFSIYHLNDLFDPGLAAAVCYPIGRFFSERLAHDVTLKETDCFGISVVYDHQLLPSVYLCRLLKQRWPEKRILLGGTSISQAYKYLRDKSLIKMFFSVADAVVVGEGETAICEIADRDCRLEETPNIPNTITYDRWRDRLHLPQRIHYENLSRLGTPMYHHPWHLYLSPERGINYAPTRGCYWNRCTFCDYGLNSDRPTSPWRERKMEQVVEDLRQACEGERVNYVYFAVDVMAPGYLERLSDAIVESGLDIRWGAELRMEKVFSAERCRKMARSGCVCVSFGMESGSQRIIDLIDKGTEVSCMRETMANFARAGIAVQLMAFMGFPTESADEKRETFRFVQENTEHWAAGGLGTFLLTGGAIIARRPEKFGLKLVSTQNADIVRAPAYECETEGSASTSRAEESDASFDANGGIFPRTLGRPWAGGIDTLHSMIYYDTYERSFFKQHALVPNTAEPGAQMSLPSDTSDMLRCTVHIVGELRESHLDIRRIIANRARLREHLVALSRIPREPTYMNFLEQQASFPTVAGTEGEKSYWLVVENKCVPVDRLIYKLLARSANSQTELGQLMTGLDPALVRRLLLYLGDLQTNELIAIQRSGQDWRRWRGWVDTATRTGLKDGRSAHEAPPWRQDDPPATTAHLPRLESATTE